jgi:drug/metabolite transporter (DMT)-like permease
MGSIFSKKTFSAPVQGAILATLSAFLMSVLMAITKTLAPDIPTTLVVFIRNLYGLLFSLPLLIKNPRKVLKSNQYGLHGIRIILSASAMLCTYYTYRHLPLTLATSLGMTGALFTTVLAVLILKDRIDSIKWLCILFGYLGALCIIQPRSITLEIGILTSLLANLFAGCSTIIGKIISKQDSIPTMVSYTNIGLTIIFGGLSYPQWQVIEGRHMLLLALCGLLGFGAHYCYLAALKKVSPSFLAPFEYTRLLFTFSIGFLCFRELPNFYTVLGSMMIIVATYLITYRDSRRENTPSS